MNLQQLESILNITVLGNDLKTYAIAALVLAGIFLFFKFLFAVLFSKLEKYSKKTKTDLDDAVVNLLEQNRWLIFLVSALLYVQVAISMTPKALSIVSGAFNFFVVYLCIRVANFWVGYITEKFVEDKKNAAEELSIRFMSKAIKILVWVFAILFLISSFGYNISSLIAGLGIGGIAVALAVQNVLGDLISCVSIYLDKPFRVGDFLVVGDQSGTVKSIGIKTTRLESLQGEEIVMSNKKLTETDINNYGRLRKRRILSTIGVTYDTPLTKMKKIPEAFEKIVNSIEDCSFDRAHFKTFGPSSKDFELVFYVESKDYYTYVNRLQKINFEIQAYFEKQKIEFAFPTQTVYVKK